MPETLRVSVRDLVAYTYFAPDITPTANQQAAMLAGGRAHRARQAQQQGEAERSVKHSFQTADAEVLVFGRMDAFTDGDVPLIEEIKLTAAPMNAPLPEHRAQAVCYAAMVACEDEREHVRIAITYVNEAGEVLRAFEEVLQRDALIAEVQALLVPFVAVALRELAHQTKRDESLRTLAFPFATYRQGQRELAVQVYTAITRRKRLFADLPTGTGKSAAVLYPALKAMGEGRTRKILYLTARNTARQSPLETLERMQHSGMQARVSVLTAKEKLCPLPITRCTPELCERAKGHYLREADAVDDLLAHGGVWTDERIMQVAEAHKVCPFELALKLTELSDVVMMDLNYAFDPFAQLNRLFMRPRGLTLLIDEAHHAVDRVRESLSGEMDGAELARIRTELGKTIGRRSDTYKSLTNVIHALRALPESCDAPPPSLLPLVQLLSETASRQVAHANGGISQLMETIRLCLSFQYAAEHFDEDYAALVESHGKERALLLYCLLPAKEIARLTARVNGAVFFSATLSPMQPMRELLGGAEEDACFSLPSPFDPTRLSVVRRRISTRYADREQSAAQVASTIKEAVLSREGKYIAYFPSYAYLRMVQEQLDETELPPIYVQARDMDEDGRARFMEAFADEEGEALGLCVLGGLFSEGIDLPGDRLIGAIIVGVGLPTPSSKMNAVQACYARHFGDGYGYACRIPAMQKVIQAAGRVIRTETDHGLIVLIDDRYARPEYTSLLPPWWQITESPISEAVKQLEAITGGTQA